MTELDLEIPGIAKELIDEYGRLVNYTVVGSNSTYDPQTSRTVLAEYPLAPLNAVIEANNGHALKAGLTEKIDYKLTVAAQDFAAAPFKISPEDRVSWDDLHFVVKHVKPTYSGELVAIYELYIVGTIAPEVIIGDGGQADFSSADNSGLLVLISEDF